MGSGTKPLSEYPVVKDILNILWIIKAALRGSFFFLGVSIKKCYAGTQMESNAMVSPCISFWFHNL